MVNFEDGDNRGKGVAVGLRASEAQLSNISEKKKMLCWSGAVVGINIHIFHAIIGNITNFKFFLDSCPVNYF